MHKIADVRSSFIVSNARLSFSLTIYAEGVWDIHFNSFEIHLKVYSWLKKIGLILYQYNIQWNKPFMNIGMGMLVCFNELCAIETSL